MAITSQLVSVGEDPLREGFIRHFHSRVIALGWHFMWTLCKDMRVDEDGERF